MKCSCVVYVVRALQWREGGKENEEHKGRGGRDI